MEPYHRLEPLPILECTNTITLNTTSATCRQEGNQRPVNFAVFSDIRGMLRKKMSCFCKCGFFAYESRAMILGPYKLIGNAPDWTHTSSCCYITKHYHTTNLYLYPTWLDMKINLRPGFLKVPASYFTMQIYNTHSNTSSCLQLSLNRYMN